MKHFTSLSSGNVDIFYNFGIWKKVGRPNESLMESLKNIEFFSENKLHEP